MFRFILKSTIYFTAYFRPIALGAIAATAVAIFLIMIGTVIDMASCKNQVTYPETEFRGIVSAYCTICFAYGGQVPVSVIISFIGKKSYFCLEITLKIVSRFNSTVRHVLSHACHGISSIWAHCTRNDRCELEFQTCT